MDKNLKNNLFKAATLGAFSLAIVLIKFFEGIEYRPYYDVAGVLTVCYGHTGDDIDAHKVYSQADCDALLHADLLAKKQEIDPLLLVPLSEMTAAALYSFVYNVGVQAFTESTLLRKLNAGQNEEACGELKRWVYADGKQWKGLITRRKIEEAICNINMADEL